MACNDTLSLIGIVDIANSTLGITAIPISEQTRKSYLADGMQQGTLFLSPRLERPSLAPNPGITSDDTPIDILGRENKPNFQKTTLGMRIGLNGLFADDTKVQLDSFLVNQNSVTGLVPSKSFLIGHTITSEHPDKPHPQLEFIQHLDENWSCACYRYSFVLLSPSIRAVS
jgi:hypothetical protein